MINSNNHIEYIKLIDKNLNNLHCAWNQIENAAINKMKRILWYRHAYLAKMVTPNSKHTNTKKRVLHERNELSMFVEKNRSFSNFSSKSFYNKNNYKNRIMIKIIKMSWKNKINKNKFHRVNKLIFILCEPCIMLFNLFFAMKICRYAYRRATWVFCIRFYLSMLCTRKQNISIHAKKSDSVSVFFFS